VSSKDDFEFTLLTTDYPGFIITYFGPLVFVLMVTMGKEAHDDYKRYQRDQEANSTKYLILDPAVSGQRDSAPATRAVPSSKLKVGDLILLEKNQRVPADLVLLRTSDATGTCFIRTDQLDGETDWKLRVAVPSTQQLSDERDLLDLDAEIYGTLASPLIRHSITHHPYSGSSNQRYSHIHRYILKPHNNLNTYRIFTRCASPPKG